MAEWAEPPEDIFSRWVDGVGLPTNDRDQPWPRVNERRGVARNGHLTTIGGRGSE